MRLLLFISVLLAAALWLAPSRVGADGVDVAERAVELDKALQAVEWYTNESVRKALQAEHAGDNASARLFGDKAIESDLKAQDLRTKSAVAWQEAGKPARALAVWHRAAEMAQERADMLGKRVEPLRQAWQSGAEGDDAVPAGESHFLYAQAVFFTAQQWVLVTQFSTAAGDKDETAVARQQAEALLRVLQQPEHQALMQQDARLAGSIEQVRLWQQSLR